MPKRLPASAAGRAKPRSLASPARLVPGAVGAVLVVLVCAPPLHAQTTRTGPASESARMPRPEETAADKLLASGKPREALAELDRVVTAYGQAGDRLGLARVALKRSGVRRSLGELDIAARDAEEAQANSASDPALRVQALTQVARVATDRTDFARADAALREALSIAERVDDSAAQATVLRNLAILDDRRGLAREALDHTTEAVSAADRSGDVSLRVRTRGAAVGALLALSRYDAALATAQESYDIADRSAVPALRAAALFDLAQAHANVWNLDRAAELWTATIEAHRQGSMPSRSIATTPPIPRTITTRSRSIGSTGPSSRSTRRSRPRACPRASSRSRSAESGRGTASWS